MAQAIWTGTISFGLVSVPVRLYPAVQRKDVRFHELDRLSGQRVHHQRVRAPLPEEPSRERRPAAEPVGWPVAADPTRGPTGRGGPEPTAVSPDEVIKGFEIAPDQYVIVERSELEALEPGRSRSIDIEQFVDIAAVDPIYFDASYYVVPTREHVRSFGLLAETLRRSKRMGICWIVLRRRRHLAALRPHGNLLILSTMLFADEVLPTAVIEPKAPSDLTPKEREMAALLVMTLSGPFEPARYRDEYREKVLAVIQGRAATAKPAPAAPTTPAVADLMAALRASIEQARQERQQKPTPAARRKRKSA